MTTPGRNDPCPCGSGKKFKKCCLISQDDSEFQYRKFRQLYDTVSRKLTDFAFAVLDEELFLEAWKDFNDHEQIGAFDPRGPITVLFMPWLLFNWIVELKPPGAKEFVATTIAEMFLDDQSANLSVNEQDFLRSSVRCPYTLCEVAEVRPGVGMTLDDLLRQTTFDVVERSASQALKRGEIIYCATSDFNGLKTNVGTGPYALQPTVKVDVFNLRKWMHKQARTDQLTSEHLDDFEYDIRGLYLEHVRAMLSPPQLANTDGDPMVPQKLYFELDSPDQAFHALRSLAKGRKKKELLSQATIKDALVVKAELEWLGGKVEARKRLGGSVLLGLLKIDNEQLIVEVNSHERARRIRRLIERRLGDAARYKTTLIEPIQSQINQMWQTAAAGAGLENGFAGGTSSNSLDEEPEVRAMMEETARQHWDSWFDLPVPALNDMTPREAAKTYEGRELLESLFLLYEIHNEESPDNYAKADIPALRRELGIDQ